MAWLRPPGPSNLRGGSEHECRQDLQPLPAKGNDSARHDADLVVYDPSYRGTISAATQTQNVDYNAFEGWEIKGKPTHVAVRGELAVRDGKFVGRRAGPPA